MNKITILLVDDHPFLRLGISTLLSTETDMCVIGEASDGKAAIKAVEQLKPAVVIMDLLMPAMSGAEATRHILSKHPETRILILTSYGSANELAEAVRFGATGVLLKDAAMRDLVIAVRTIAQGKQYIPSDIQKTINSEALIPQLTDRQRAILESAMRGLSDREIGVQFGMSHSGARHHMQAIFAKLGAANRAEAVAIALRKHLLKI